MSTKAVKFHLVSVRWFLPIHDFPVLIYCPDEPPSAKTSDADGYVTLTLPAHQSCKLKSGVDTLPITARAIPRTYEHLEKTVPDIFSGKRSTHQEQVIVPVEQAPITLSSDYADDMTLYVDVDTPIQREHHYSCCAAVGIKPQPIFPSDKTNSLIRLFYATDRQTITSTASSTAIDYGPNENPEERLHYGTCLVSIPRDHRMGELETSNILRLEFRPDPERHILLKEIRAEQLDQFRAELNDTIDRSPFKDVLVFIHGFNVSFEDAARRTAQIAYDLGFKCAPVLYSWPSRGSLDAYTADEDSVQWTAQHLKLFLEMLASETHAGRIHVIAHSMGNRALLSALSSFTDNYPNIQEVALAAPDISAPVFKQLVPLVQMRAKRITLYASSNDQALVLSERLHHYPRAGESGDRITIIPPVETIDASTVATDFIGHSYVMDRTSVLSDLFYLLSDQPASKRFGLVEKSYNGAIYWAFKQ